MAHSEPPRFAGCWVAPSMARYFRDLATLADGWWVWPDTVGKEGDNEIFIPLAEWNECLKQRKTTPPE